MNRQHSYTQQYYKFNNIKYYIIVYTTLLVKRSGILQLLNPFGVQVRRVYGHHFGGQESMHAEQQALQVLTYQFLIRDKNTKSIKIKSILRGEHSSYDRGRSKIRVSYKTLQYSLQ